VKGFGPANRSEHENGTLEYAAILLRFRALRPEKAAFRGVLTLMNGEEDSLRPTRGNDRKHG